MDYFDDESGPRPAEEFIDGLDPKMRSKVFGRLGLLEEYDNRPGMPRPCHLNDGIYEVRTPQGGDITRALEGGKR